MVGRGRAHLVEVDDEGLRWAKSSASNGAQQGCIEVARRANYVLVRSSKNRTGPRLSCSMSQWVSFLDWLRPNG